MRSALLFISLSDNPIANDKAVAGSTNYKEVSTSIDIELWHEPFRIVAESLSQRSAMPVLPTITELMNPKVRSLAWTANATGEIGDCFNEADNAPLALGYWPFHLS